MAASDFITFTIQINNAGLSQEGFGTPLLVSYNAPFSDEVREYGQYADVLVDFATGTPEADVADAIFSQSPHPVTLKIGKGLLKPTLQYTVGTITVNPNYPYVIQIDGHGITSTAATYTSTGTPSAGAINAGLITALNAVVGKNYTATSALMSNLTGQAFTADDTTNHFTATGHGYLTGDGPVQASNVGGALPAGLAASTNYWVIRIDANTFELATSQANAFAGTAITITTNGTGTQTVTPQTGATSPGAAFTVTGNAAGNWFSLDIQKPSILSNKMTHADPGVATDLAAINAYDNDWYWLITQWNSKQMVEGTSAWVEPNGKAYVVAVVDTDALNTASGNADTLDALNTLGYKRTCGKYHNSPLQAFDAASIGVIAPLNPGQWTEAFKTLVGVAPITLTPTQRANLRARNAGTYTNEKGRNITWDGKVFSTVYGYLDITVGIDWFSDAVVTAALGVLVSLAKVAYTDEDIDMIAGAIRGVLLQASSAANPVLDPGDPSDNTNPPPSITFPTVASISPAIRALRILPNGVIQGRLQGAIQSIQFMATLTF